MYLEPLKIQTTKCPETSGTACPAAHWHIPEDCNVRLTAVRILNLAIQYRTVSAYIYRVSQQERTKLRKGVPYVKVYRYNSKHLYPKLNGYGDNGKRSLKI